ncbi:EFR1 family ferrodoxin [Desulforamulus ruminis]|uniref:4Fe-4S ferredoxin iron-sulfur binding domain protein n=1 Tax=Desulforamulus ruminis (strain ATCC 23193 / DSM 2154 / NCIMB 8452 / DL) TaxID=696281 RepID=F6DSL1_DESRL|nr:EFR1 family ferrodoxin [Desulforamulus ruminis]AEG61101.1 4Fe-4S ferredoxin iron-sulfur binding domain protein [Desulforamulus ruminis DSM 2154]
MIKQTQIYYMSGTGNTRRVAHWFADVAREKGIPSKIYQITKHGRQPKVNTCSTNLLGILFPTHGFTAPWLIIRFVLSLPRGKGTQAFAVATRAGLKIGPVFTPGFEGTAVYLVALLLLLKGYNIRLLSGIDMVSNWLALHWGLSPANSRAIIDRNKPRALKMANILYSGGRYIRGQVQLVLGILLFQISLGYLLMGRFMLAKLFYANENCNGCGLCEKNCPTGSVKMRGWKKKRPFWSLTCESCMRCMGFCPKKAVEASHPLFAVMIYLISIPLSAYILYLFGQQVTWLTNLSGWARVIVNYVYSLSVITAAYFIFMLLMRIPLINRLLTYLTPVHYYRRYHEPDTKLKDFLE